MILARSVLAGVLISTAVIAFNVSARADVVLTSSLTEDDSQAGALTGLAPSAQLPSAKPLRAPTLSSRSRWEPLISLTIQLPRTPLPSTPPSPGTW